MVYWTSTQTDSRKWQKHGLKLYRAARNIAHKDTEEAKLLFYNEMLKDLHESDKILKELRNLGLCYSGFDSPCIFTTEELNIHFSSISSDPSAPSVSVFLEAVADKDFFPHFSFSEVTLDDVKFATKQLSSQVRGHDVVSQSIICAAFPAIGEFILDIFNMYNVYMWVCFSNDLEKVSDTSSK